MQRSAVVFGAGLQHIETGDLGAGGNGAVRGLGGPAAALRGQVTTLGPTAVGQAFTHSSTLSAHGL
ncbi:hypothetical protein B4N89_00210 [Embleya scabrispora]|uniref:Uncharacterized protein n=1 Tax=Embleya scabrispora TaxID=159449 RepID=A0A1T3NRQ1_9ACTN|nr:hypothetical protein B4N89_00210 [Embleya scabrispora]